MAGAIAMRPGSAPAEHARGEEAAIMHQPVPREFRSMLREMSARNVEKYDRTLVSFGTRQALSSTTDPNRGIGAAANYVFTTAQRLRQRLGWPDDRREADLDPAEVADPNDRLPRDVEMTNVIATLKGTQAASANRVYVVSGHLDTRCTDAIDAVCDAPGADDDGSGVSAMMEMARVMAKHSFDATIKFIAVDGEEEGLYGSTHFAQDAKAKGMDIEGMLDKDIVGSSTGDRGQRELHVIRLFAEGVPPRRRRTRRACGSASAVRTTRRRASSPATPRRLPRRARPT